MASESIKCRCSQFYKVKKMTIAFIGVCIFLCFAEQTVAVPDYKKLHENLSEKKDNDNGNVKGTKRDGSPIVAEIGKVFKFSLDDYILKGDETNKPVVKIFQHGSDDLPLWLSYSEKKNRLVGVPTSQDKGTVKIVVKIALRGMKKKFKFEIDVKEGKDKFHCHHGNPAFVAAALLSIDIKDFNGLGRLKLLRKFSDYVDVAVHDFVIEAKKPGSVFDVSMETAGPGDGIITQKPGVIIKWKVDCKLGLAGDFSVNTLKASSGNKRIFNSVGVPFLGWYVYRHQARVRRQVFPAATPAATPTATVKVPGIVTSVISGTPVISATPTLVIKATTTIAVVSTSSTPAVVKPTPVITTKPPTTTPETTTKPPTTTKEPTTTQPPSTTQKATTTEEQTTKMATTESTTKKPTTKEVIKVTTEIKTTTMKPETTMQPETTMKPETTVVLPKTTKMQPPTIPVTKPKDKGPELKNSIDLITAKVGQPIKVKIERDVFEDDIDGDTYSLTLALKRNVAQKLVDVDESLIFLDTQNFYLYMLPMFANVGDNSFALQATDSSGHQRNAVFTVKVGDENIQYNDIFNVTIQNADFDKFMKNAMKKVNLVEKIARATDLDYRTIRLQKFYRGSVIMSYASSDLQTDSCNSVKAEAYKTKIEGSEFRDKMAPDYIVSKTSSAKVRNCGNGMTDKNPTKQSRSGTYKWWEVVLIPVIVIAVLLLVIGLIFFFLYRRKRRYEPQKEDKNTFLYQKKPVIFREEYDEKPDVVSLEPLILPNEKMPLTNSAYQPRSSTPDGNGSSSASTDADDKTLIDNKAAQTPPPRSPQYRSPPPYSEP